MRSSADPGDVVAVEAMILAADESKPGWQRRAVGTTREEALAQIRPDDHIAAITTQVPIGAYRILQRHIADTGENQARWLREAIVERYLRQGGDPAAGAAMLAMKRDGRRYDVPRDVKGQPRTRKGRQRGDPTWR